MAADVFHHLDEVAIDGGPAGRVDGAGFAVQCLPRRQRIEGPKHGREVDALDPLARRQRQRREVECREAFDAADAAAGAARQAATPVLQALEAARRNVEPNFDAGHAVGQAGVARRDRHHLDATAIGRGVEDAFAQREAEREGLEVLRRRHHHRVRNAVEDQRHRHFGGQRVVAQHAFGRRGLLAEDADGAALDRRNR